MIFLCGHHNTGKTTIANWLKDFGFPHVETGNVIREIYNNLSNNTKSFENWAVETNKRDPHFFDECLLDKIKKINFSLSNNKDIVVTGNRQKSGVEYLIKNAKNSKKNIVLFLDAPISELFQRQIKRTDRIIPNLTFALFKNDYIGFDEAMGVEKIREISDSIIDTHRDIGEIKKDIKLILQDKGYII